MRTYKLTIAYDGSRFRGWQRQPDTDMTIQGILERDISEYVGYKVEVNGSGRTDGGVHASGQTASIILSGKVDEPVFLTEINEKIPEDIRIVNMELAKNGFHARHSARGKRYEYTIDTAEKADVFLRKYFKSHNSLDLPDGIELIPRTDIIVRQDGHRLRIEYTGSGFMYHMVRILTGTLLEIGSGRRSPESINEIIESGQRADAGFLVPASGLCLKEVFYK